MHIGVVGSVNLDIIAHAERLPLPGETVTGAKLSHHPGGKGANQALAARLLGADVSLIAKVGKDTNADLALALIQQAGVDLTRARRDPSEPTGVALIVVANGGENQIVVAPGANRFLRPEDVHVDGLDAVLCQLEIPIETVVAVAEMAKASLFCLNAAPVRAVPDHLLERADLIVVNEIEQTAFSDRLARIEGLVAVTHGARGAVLYRRGREVARAAPPGVEAVDTVGAGDAFVAGLVVAMLEARSVGEMLERAVVAGALSTTKQGAQPSMPTRSEVDALWNNCFRA